MNHEQKMLLCDPQTSGGLLAVVRPEAVADFKQIAETYGLSLESIGTTLPSDDQPYLVEVV